MANSRITSWARKPGEQLPVVYRWPYEYGLPGATSDFVPQNVPDEQIT